MSTDPTRLTTALAGHYLIERELGHSGMATVRPARSPRYERPDGPALDSEHELG